MRSRNVFRKTLLVLVLVFGASPLHTWAQPWTASALQKPSQRTNKSGSDKEARIEQSTQGGVTDEVIEVDGQKRSFTLFRPKSLAQAPPSGLDDGNHSHLYPLVLVFHGSYASGRKIMAYTGMNDLAERENFLVAYPDMQYVRNWNLPKDFHNPDIHFVSALIRHLSQTDPVDPQRIYATGYSAGADFLQLAACNPLLSSEIAAFAPVCSNLDRNWAVQCQQRHPIAILLVNGTDDQLNCWDGHGKRWMSVAETFAFWAHHNGAQVPLGIDIASKTSKLSAGDRTQAELVTAENNTVSAEVELLKIYGGGHTWPGAHPQNWLMSMFLGPTHQSDPANKVIWAFFQRNPLRGGFPLQDVEHFTELGQRPERVVDHEL